MKKILLLIIVLELAIIPFIFLKQGGVEQEDVDSLGSTTQLNILNGTSNHINVDLDATTSTEILAAGAKQFMRICNEEGTNVAYLAVGTDAVSSTGIYVAPKSCWPTGEFISIGGKNLEGTTNASASMVVYYEN